MYWRIRRASALAVAIAAACFAIASSCAFAQTPNPFNGILGTITKSATDAFQNGVDKALGTSSSDSGTQKQSVPPVQSPSMASAQTQTPAKPSPPPILQKRPAATPTEIDNAVQQYHDGCAIHTTYLRNLHDCECLTRGERAILQKSQSVQATTEEQYQLGQTCPAAKQVTYDWVYKSCDDYMQHTRSDHAQFCACTAERFSDAFGAHPNSNLRKVEALRRESMEACGIRDRSHNIH